MMEGDLFIFPLFWSRHDYHARFKKILPSSTPPSILPKTYPYQQLQLTFTFTSPAKPKPRGIFATNSILYRYLNLQGPAARGVV